MKTPLIILSVLLAANAVRNLSDPRFRRMIARLDRRMDELLLTFLSRTFRKDTR